MGLEEASDEGRDGLQLFLLEPQSLCPSPWKLSPAPAHFQRGALTCGSRVCWGPETGGAGVPTPTCYQPSLPTHHAPAVPTASLRGPQPAS